jgi:hypothetical protein
MNVSVIKYSYGMQLASGRLGAPVDSTTYYLAGTVQAAPTTSADLGFSRMYVPIAGKLVYAFCNTYVAGTLGTTEDVAFTLRLNGSDTALSWVQDWNLATNPVGSDTDTGITVAQGDYLTLKVVTPAWATNPTNVDTIWGVGIQSA